MREQSANGTSASTSLTPSDLAFLDQQGVARLATVETDGRPHVVPVCFARVGVRLYVAIDAKPKRGNPRDLKRLQNIRAHPLVTLVVDHYDDDWRRLRWLMVRCAATILEEGDERAAALAALEQRYPQYASMGLARLGLPVIALEPSSASRWSAAR